MEAGCDPQAVRILQLSIRKPYIEEDGCPEGDIAPNTLWEDVPEDFECPICCVGKDQFSEVKE